MTAKRVRWNCPNDEHPGVLGPQVPPRHSVIRYCLPCTARTGELVERITPALARQRRAEVKLDRDRYVVDGIDLHAEMHRLVRLRAFGGPDGPLARRLPRFDISRRTRQPRSRLGTAYPDDWRIIVATWPDLDSAEARETLVHELTHLYVNGALGVRRWHGEEFRETMRAAFREAYGPDVVGVKALTTGGPYAAALRRLNADGPAA